MVHVANLDVNIVDGELPFIANRSEVKLSLKFVKLNRKVDAIHLLCDDFTQRLFSAFSSDDRQFISGDEGRLEEGKSLDVIPMRMRDEEIGFDRLSVVY